MQDLLFIATLGALVGFASIDQTCNAKGDFGVLPGRSGGPNQWRSTSPTVFCPPMRMGALPGCSDSAGQIKDCASENKTPSPQVLRDACSARIWLELQNLALPIRQQLLLLSPFRSLMAAMTQEHVAGRLHLLAGRERSAQIARNWLNNHRPEARAGARELGEVAVLHTNLSGFKACYDTAVDRGVEALRFALPMIRDAVLQGGGTFERCVWDTTSSVFSKTPVCDGDGPSLEEPVISAVDTAVKIMAGFEKIGEQFDLNLGVGLVVSGSGAKSFALFGEDVPPEMVVAAPLVPHDSTPLIPHSSHVLADHLSRCRYENDIGTHLDDLSRELSQNHGSGIVFDIKSIHDFGTRIVLRRNKRSMFLAAGLEANTLKRSSSLPIPTEGFDGPMRLEIEEAKCLEQASFGYYGTINVLFFTSSTM